MTLHSLGDGKFIRDFPLDMGTISSYSGKRYQTEIFYGFVSFLTPGIFYRCDMTSEELVPEASTCTSLGRGRGWGGGGRLGGGEEVVSQLGEGEVGQPAWGSSHLAVN